MSIIATIEDFPISWDNFFVRFMGRGRIDDDGLGDAHGDPCHQQATSLKLKGRSLNADLDNYIVVPPQILYTIKPVVLGSQAWVTYRGITATAVVGDVGPGDRLGEISVALARRLGIDADPVRGGEDRPVLAYKIRPGFPAAVDGIKYQLQPA